MRRATLLAMTFSPRGLLYLAGFLGAVALAVNAREGSAASWLGVAGIAAVILIDWVLTFLPALAGRGRGTERRP